MHAIMAAGGFHLLQLSVVFVLSFYIATDAQSITQASFQENPIAEDGTAIFICKASNLGSNFITIERTIFSRTEQLVVDQRILDSVDDNFFLSVFNNDDGSETYSMTIRGVYHLFDAGTYTCKINTIDGVVLAQQSAQLNIIYNPASSDPRCSIVGSSENLSRVPGTEVRLGCHSEIGYPPVDISWSYTGCNTNRVLPQPELTNSGVYYSELRVTLFEEDNGGRFICTISRSDGSFSSNCFRGPFMISGGTECVLSTTPSMVEENTSMNSGGLSTIPSMVEENNSMTSGGLNTTPSMVEENSMSSMNASTPTSNCNVLTVSGYVVSICLLLTLYSSVFTIKWSKQKTLYKSS